MKAHQQTLDPEAPRDFIDVYLKQVQEETDPSSSFYGAHGINSMLAVISDLFLAGMETTSSMCSWAFYFMAKYPEVQARVHEELDQVENS